jgi:glycerophosphoryl diester phosphodiesterase
VTLVLAHRGSRTRAPENTLRAFGLAIDEGADGVELDVRTCRTGEVVVVHDPNLWRTGGDPREVAELSVREVRAADVGEGERVPLLEEALDLVIGRGGIVNVEVKGDVPDRPGCARAVGRALMRRSARDRDQVIVSTFDPLTFLVLRASTRGVALGFLFDDRHTGVYRAIVVRRWLRPDAVHPERAIATPRAIARWRRRGLRVHVWTVNDPDEARALSRAGVDALITDDPIRMRAALE